MRVTPKMKGNSQPCVCWHRQARQDLQKLKEEEETMRAYSATAVPDAETNGHSAAAEEPVFL